MINKWQYLYNIEDLLVFKIIYSSKILLLPNCVIITIKINLYKGIFILALG